MALMLVALMALILGLCVCLCWASAFSAEAEEWDPYLHWYQQGWWQDWSTGEWYWYNFEENAWEHWGPWDSYVEGSNVPRLVWPLRSWPCRTAVRSS